MKRCPSCRNLLPLEAYHRCTNSHDGVQGYCKGCLYEAASENRRKRKAADPKHHWSQYVISNTKQRCKKSGRSCNITPAGVRAKLAEQGGECFYCGEELLFTRFATRRGPKPNSPSLDRVDNTRGYEPDNVVISCNQCNVATGTLDADGLRRIADGMDRFLEDK